MSSRHNYEQIQEVVKDIGESLENPVFMETG